MERYGAGSCITLLFSAFILCCLLFPPAPVAAQNTREGITGEAQPSVDDLERSGRKLKDWYFYVAAYGWLAGVNGDIVTNGTETSINSPFNDIAERVKGGFQVYTEARWRKWFVAFDGTWANLGETSEGTLVDLEVDVEQRIFDVRVGRELFRRQLGDVKRNGDTTWGRRKSRQDWVRESIVDLFIGGRYYLTRPTVITTEKIFGTRTETSTTDERVDPFIGVRAARDLSRRWSIGIRGDIGGFGIANAAQFTWQVEGFVGFRVSSLIRIFGGYRALHFDTIEGSGANRNGQSLYQHGPTIGAGFFF